MSRIAQLRQRLSRENIDTFLLFNQYNITYLSGFNGHAATVLMTPTQNYLLTDYRYVEQAKAQVTGFVVICRDRINQTLGQLINQLLQSENQSRLAFEAEHISVSQWQQLLSELSLTATPTPVYRFVEDLRYVKDTHEIASIRQAAAIADQALANILPLIKPGISERDLAIELDYQMSKLGSQELSFATILLFGERSALPHGIPGNRKLNHGELMLVDFGAVINGYRSDMTRTYVLGKADRQQKAVFQTVQRAQQAAIDAIAAGVTGEFLYQQSAAVIQASDFASYMGEGLGHGVGLQLHEWPFIGQGCQLPITKGMVITIEPGIYIPGWGGVRIEDDVVLTDDGLQIINGAPKSLLEL